MKRFVMFMVMVLFLVCVVMGIHGQDIYTDRDEFFLKLFNDNIKTKSDWINKEVNIYKTTIAYINRMDVGESSRERTAREDAIAMYGALLGFGYRRGYITEDEMWSKLQIICDKVINRSSELMNKALK